MKVYISGSITNNEKYIEQFKRAEQWLKLNDYTPINPVPVIAPITDKLTHAEIMCVCYALINTCDMVYMLKGWQGSKGSCAELVYAKSREKQIKYEDKQRIFKRTIFGGANGTIPLLTLTEEEYVNTCEMPYEEDDALSGEAEEAHAAKFEE